MTLDQLNKVMRDTVNAIIPSVNVIRYYPNAPSPDGDYATVNIASLEKIGIVDAVYADNVNDVDQVILLQYKALISVNFYRTDARQNTALFAASLPMQSIMDVWNANKIGLNGLSEIRDLTALTNNEHEERSQVDIAVHFLLTPKTETLIGIDSFIINGQIDNGAKIVDNISIIVEDL